MTLKATRTQAKALQANIDGECPRIDHQDRLQALQANIDGEWEEVKPKRPRDNQEETEQRLLFEHRDEMLAHYPALAWLFATFNGIYLPGALKQKIKAQGLTQGVLDLWLPCRREEPDGTLIPGLAMDLKSAKGRPTPKQLEWAAMLISNGWRVYFPSSAQEAWWLIASYLGIIGKDHYAKTLQLRSDYQKHLTGNSEHP